MNKKEEKILTALDSGEPISSIAEIFKVSTVTIIEIKKRHPDRYKFNRKNPEKKDRIIPKVRISARIPHHIWEKINIMPDKTMSEFVNEVIEKHFEGELK